MKISEIAKPVARAAGATTFFLSSCMGTPNIADLLRIQCDQGKPLAEQSQDLGPWQSVRLGKTTVTGGDMQGILVITIPPMSGVNVEFDNFQGLEETTRLLERRFYITRGSMKLTDGHNAYTVSLGEKSGNDGNTMAKLQEDCTVRRP